MQVGVAVQNVVTGTPADAVAAGAAEENIAAEVAGRFGSGWIGEHRACWQAREEEISFGGGVAEDRCGHVSAHICEPLDERWIVHHIPGHHHAGLVVTLDDIVEHRAAGAFRQLVDVAEAIAARRILVGDKFPARHVDFDALGLVLERGPIEAEAAVELQMTADTKHNVVAAEALHDRADAADQNVVAGIERETARGCADVAEQYVAAIGATDDPIVALVALNLLATFAAKDNVVAGTAHDVVDTLAAVDDVLAVAAGDDVIALAADDGVVAGIAVEYRSNARVRVRQDVIAITTEQVVIATTTVDGIVAAVAIDCVIVRLAGHQPVVAVGTAEHHGVAEEIILAEEMDGAVGEDFDERMQQAVGPGECRQARGRIDGRIAIAIQDEAAVGIVQIKAARLDLILGRQEDAGR